MRSGPRFPRSCDETVNASRPWIPIAATTSATSAKTTSARACVRRGTVFSRDDVAQRLDVGDRLLGICARNDGADWADERGGGHGGALWSAGGLLENTHRRRGERESLKIFSRRKGTQPGGDGAAVTVPAFGRHLGEASKRKHKPDAFSWLAFSACSPRPPRLSAARPLGTVHLLWLRASVVNLLPFSLSPVGFLTLPTGSAHPSRPHPRVSSPMLPSTDVRPPRLA